MIYHMHVPRPPLDHYIEHFWYYEGHTAPTHAYKLLPDGAMELIIDLTDIPKRLYHSYRGQFRTFRNCWISGLQKGFLIIGNEPNSSMMGARFRPGGAFPVFGFPMTELAAQVNDLESVWKRDALALREQILEQPTPQLKFTVLETFLARRAHQRVAQDRALEFALREMRGNEPDLVRSLANSVGLSHKGLIDRFHRRVGVGPKFVARVLRFQRVIQGVGQQDDVDWTEAAHHAGYYDQPHFNHEFRDFTGLAPAEYLRSRGPFLNWIPMPDPAPAER
jgi:AraC-like DNA-binding protein